MWQIKTFKTAQAMNLWISANKDKYQIDEVFVDNGYAIEYKPICKIVFI